MNRLACALQGGVVSLTLCGAARAEKTEIYFDDFQKAKSRPEWGANQTFADSNNFTRFMGRYSEFDAINLTVPVPDGAREGLRQGQSLQYGVTFDFYAIDSWDGSDPKHGIDSFQVFVDGTPWFDETFANTHKWQTFREPDIGRAHLGFNAAWKDSIYLGIDVPFSVDDWREAFSITFRGRYLTGLNDESWGIDNVHVWYEVVPSPGAAAALVLGGLGVTRRRR